MLRSLLLVLVVSLASQIVSAQAPLHALAETARYVAYLEVVALEHSDEIVERDGERPRYQPSYAVCRVREFLLGYLLMDRNGHVRVVSASPRSTLPGEEVAFEVGDRITLISHGAAGEIAGGMVFDGLHSREQPRRELRRLLRERQSRARGVVNAIERMKPGASEEASQAMEDLLAGARTDLAHLSPEADLVFDLVAEAEGMPGLPTGKRRDLTADQRRRLALIALRGVCAMSEQGAAKAATLVAAEGNGAMELLRPAALDAAAATRVLAELNEMLEAGPLLRQLLRHDRDGRALGWAMKMALADGAMAWEAQWMIVELLEEGAVTPQALYRTLSPQGAEAPSRAIADLREQGAWRLLAAVATIGAHAQAGDSKAQASLPPVELTELTGRVEYLEVYTYRLALRGESDSLSNMRDALQSSHKDLGRAVDFRKLEDAKWAIRKLEGRLPPALPRLERRR